MPQHLEKILAHAERQLASAEAQRPSDVLPVYPKFLKIEEHRLRLRQQAGDGGREVCARRVDLVDVLLRRVFSTICRIIGNGNGESPIALVALGGYGRGELNPFSDVDIMFLHEDAMKQLDPRLNDIVQHILYMLWDVGFKVRHSTRSISGSLKHANEDIQSKTALLEARFIA